MPPSLDGSYDVLTLGETLLWLSPPCRQRFEQAHLFEIGVGGSELNVGCLLARLGRRVAWVSRLPVGPLGRIVDSAARPHGDRGTLRHAARRADPTTQCGARNP